LLPALSSTKNQFTNITGCGIKVFGLEFNTDHYYIKCPSIVEKIHFNNRTFYATFKRIDTAPTPLLLRQHLNKQHTIALPLLQKGRTDYLVIEYSGENYRQFYHLVKHLMQTQHITHYQIYQGKKREKIQLFIRVNALPLEEAEMELQALSAILEQRLDRAWKCLPSTSLPEAYNIVTLPYKRLDRGLPAPSMPLS